MRYSFSLSRSAACLPLLWISLLVLTALPGWSQVSVLTQHNDNLRTGANFNETTLTTSNVNSNTFGKLFSLPVDGFTYTQPLCAAGLTISGGTHNVVYVATAHNSVYAFDADNGTQFWKTSLGTPIPAFLHGGNIKVEIGITGTPVIDPGSNTLYVVSATYENNAQIFRLHALNLVTGAEKFGGPTLISAQVNGTGDGNDGAGHVSFLASHQNQRPALTLLNGIVYIAFSSHEDVSPYHGWVLAYDAATLQQVAVFNDTPNGGDGGIWMGGQGLTVDSANNLYLMTGNSTQSGENNAGDYGESFLKLTLSGSSPHDSLAESDYFKANNYDNLNANDNDLGSGGAVAIPGTTYLVGAGKQGLLYVVDSIKMGGLNTGKDQVVQEFQAGNGLFGAPVFWNSSTPTLYLWGRGDSLRAYPFANGLFATTPSSVSVPTTPVGQDNSGNPCGALSLSSNGSAPGTGIVWAAAPQADPESQTVKGTLYAFDAANVAKELWDSRQIPNRDDYGNYAKWEPPTVANGKVYVSTLSGQVCVYGLLPPAPPAPPAALTAIAGNEAAVLKWPAAPQAIDYNVKRASQSGGPYATIATGVTTLSYPDKGLTNGATYYYVVSARNAFGESAANSPEAAVTPSASAQGGILSLNFVADDPTPMDGSESAGVVPAVNWNNGTGNNNSLASLQDNLGLPTSASASWAANNPWANGIADTPGNSRMMNGYLDTTNTSTVTVTVSALSSLFTSNGYDVYVYCNCDGSTTRSGDYTLGGTTIHEQNMPPFTGAFVQANNSQGNYVKFTGLTGSSFTLTARPSPVGGGQRSPVNGLQIVAHVPPPAPMGLTTTAFSGQVQLGWTAPNGPVHSYNVYRGISAGQESATPIATGLTNPFYTDTIVTNETKYHYQVTAVNASGESPRSNEAVATPSVDIVLQPVVQINAGGGAVAPFAADTDFSGGGANSTGAPIDTSASGSAPAAVYQTGRYGAFSYVIPGLTHGVGYLLRLHFAETYWNQSGKRIQNVTVNGAPFLSSFDIFAASGGANKAVVKTLAAAADASGAITVNFANAAGSPDTNALVAGLEVLAPAAPVAPTVATPASASPSRVTGTTTNVSVLGADAAGEGTLAYTWSATGPAPVTFSVSGTNAAKNATAAFTQVGAYTLTAAITNDQGAAITSSVNVTVLPQAPIADSYVWSGIFANQNKGTATHLDTRRISNDSSALYNRCAYLKFNLTKLTQAPSAAQLTLTVDATSYPATRQATIQLYSVADTSWNEYFLSWNNAPGLNRTNFTSTGTLLDSQVVLLKPGTVVSYDVTSFVASHLGQVVTWQLMNPNVDSLTCNFVSREGAIGKPALTLSY